MAFLIIYFNRKNKYLAALAPGTYSIVMKVAIHSESHPSLKDRYSENNPPNQVKFGGLFIMVG